MQFKDKQLNLTTPRVMGILNVTPDSFSDGGQFQLIDDALKQVQRMLEEGADFIDVGGESTRPGAEPVSCEQEIERTIPVIEAIVQRFDTIVSIDTSKAQVMKEAVNAGAGLINDVCALQQPKALATAAESGVAVCLMHMQGSPCNMQHEPQYDSVVEEVGQFLKSRVQACLAQGIDQQRIIVDPGFGFGKTLQHNYRLLAQLPKLLDLGLPLLIGMSRKSMIAKVLNHDTDNRMAGSVAAATIAMMQGASILRVHDVKQTKDAVQVVSALRENKE